MDNILIFTATTKIGYSWYKFNSESNECAIEPDPYEWEIIKNYFPTGGHLPALAIINNNEKGISICISGIKSHRLEKNTGQIVDTILISSRNRKLSTNQLVLLTKFLEASPLDFDNPFNEHTYSAWFTDLSKCITNNGEGGVAGVNFDYEKFRANISQENNNLIEDSWVETNDTESDIALDTFANRLTILKNVSRYVYNSKFPISLLITYGADPKEMEGNVFTGLTVHSKVKTDLSGQEHYQAPAEKIYKKPADRTDENGENFIRDESSEDSIEDGEVKRANGPSGVNASERATNKIEVDTNKIIGIAVTSAGIVISVFYGRITIITALITGTGLYLYSKSKKPK